MAGLSLGITWANTPDIVLTENGEEIARIIFVIGKGKGKKIRIDAKNSIKISREPSKKGI